MYYTNLKTSENFWFFSLNKRTVTENWRKIYKISMKWKMHTGRWGSKLLPITAPLICFTGQHIERLAPPSHFPQMFQFQDWGTLSLNTCLILCKGQCEQNKTRHNNPAWKPFRYYIFRTVRKWILLYASIILN